MSNQVFKVVEVINRLKRGTVDGKLQWIQAAKDEPRYVAAMESGHIATISCTATGSSVALKLASDAGVQTLDLDSSAVTEDLVRLAILQLFVTVRESIANRMADQALDAVRDL